MLPLIALIMLIVSAMLPRRHFRQWLWVVGIFVISLPIIVGIDRIEANGVDEDAPQQEMFGMLFIALLLLLNGIVIGGRLIILRHGVRKRRL